MTTIRHVVMAACGAVLVSTAAHAQVTLNSVRVAAADTVALAKFYQSAFGMQEVNRIDVPGGPEIFVNFGAAPEAAKANSGVPIVIMHRDSDAVKDPIGDNDAWLVATAESIDADVVGANRAAFERLGTRYLRFR